MNKYLFQAVTNVALVAGIVYLAMNDHPWFAFLLSLGIRIVSKSKDTPEPDNADLAERIQAKGQA